MNYVEKQPMDVVGGFFAHMMGMQEHPPMPFSQIPINEDAYHGVFGEIVRRSAPESESHQMIRLLGLLTVFGSMIGRGSWWEVEGKRHYGNLFVVFVGATSVGRKGTGLSAMERIWNSVDKTFLKAQRESGLSSGEGLVSICRDEVRDERTDTVLLPGRIDKRIVVVEEEFAVALRRAKNEKNSLSALLRAAWDGLDLSVMTKVPQHATNPHISIMGTISQEELTRELTAVDFEGGLVNRFLWVKTHRVQLLPFGSMRKLDWSEEAARLWEAVAFGKRAGEIELDANAKKRWARLYEHQFNLDHPDNAWKKGLFAKAIGRAEPQVLRLSMLYAIADCSPMIRSEHLSAGLAVWQYCEETARQVFGGALSKLQRKIWEGMQKLGPMNPTRIVQDVLKKNSTKAEVEVALAEMLKNGWVKKEDEDIWISVVDKE